MLPFFIGAAFQGAYLAMHSASFRQVEVAMPQDQGADPLVTVAGVVDSRPPPRCCSGGVRRRAEPGPGVDVRRHKLFGVAIMVSP